MKQNYFDNDGADIRRKQRRKKQRSRQRGKTVLLVSSLLVLAVAVFLITVKALVPEFELKSFLPEKAVSFVQEDVLGKTTATTTTTRPYSRITTTKKTVDYLEDTEFDFNTGKQGNFVGNLLNGGKVGTDFTYTYHIVDKQGIFRFNPNTESYSLVYKTEDTLSCLNLRGDYFYYVNDTKHTLCKLQKGTSKPKTIARDVRFVYVYDSLVYFVTNTNMLCVMDVKALTPVTVYYSTDDTLQFIGISKERIFFSVTDYEGNTEFLTTDTFGKTAACRFRESSEEKFYNNFVMENGYLYYLKRDTESGEGFILCRQKFGSEKEVELTKTDTNRCFPVADNNRLYYADWKDGKLLMKEFNMNSKTKKTMLSVSKVSDDAFVQIQHGYQYDFIIGDGYYSGSCIDTGSQNVMKFKNGKWKY